MAQGDFTLYNEFSGDLLKGVHDLDAGTTLRVALITNATPPTAADLTPTLTDYTEVTGGTSYVTPGAAIGSNAISAVSGSTYKLDGNDISWTQDASGPTNIYYAIVYNDAPAGNNAIGYIDMTTDGGTTPVSLQAGDINITWNASGILTLA